MILSLTMPFYEPLSLPVTNGSITLTNDHTGNVEINELTPGNTGDVLRINLQGHNGTPNVYIGTEGSASIIPASSNNNFPRITPMDETAVLAWNGSQWELSWE